MVKSLKLFNPARARSVGVTPRPAFCHRICCCFGLNSWTLAETWEARPETTNQACLYIYIYIIASKAMNWNFCKAMESTPPKSWVGSGSLTDGSMCSCIYICIYIYMYICDTGPSGYCIYIIIQSQDTFHCQNVSYPIENRCIPHGPSCFPPWLQGIKTIAGPRRWPPGCGSWKLEGIGSGDVFFFHGDNYK